MEGSTDTLTANTQEVAAPAADAQMTEAEVIAAAAAAQDAVSEAQAASTGELAPSQKQVDLFNRLRRKAERMNAKARKAVNASPAMQEAREEYRWDEAPLPQIHSSAEIEIPQMPETLREMSETISDFKWRVSRQELTNLTRALKVDAAPLKVDMTKIHNAVLAENGHPKIYAPSDVTRNPVFLVNLRERVAEEGASAINGGEFVALWESYGLSADPLPLDARNHLAIDASVTESQTEYAMALLEKLGERHAVTVRERFDAQQALIAKKLHPIKQEHVSFEVARLSIISEAARRGVDVPQIDTNLPRAAQFKAMNGELKRLYKLPTRAQVNRYNQLIRLTESNLYPPEEVATFDGMFKALERLNKLANEKIAEEAAKASSVALPEEMPHAEGSFSEQLLAESGTAIADEEFVRQSEPYYDQEDASTANFTPEEVKAAREQQAARDLTSDPYVNRVRAQVRDVGASAAITQNPDLPEMLTKYLGKGNVPLGEDGQIKLEATAVDSPNDVLERLLDRLAEARAAEERFNKSESDSAPTAARGDWGDRDAERVTEAQQYKFEQLADQAGIEILPQGEKLAKEFNPETATQVVQPATKSEMSERIDQLASLVSAREEARIFTGTVQHLSPEIYEKVAAKLPIESADYIQLRFREGMSAGQAAMRLKIDAPTAASREKIATHQFTKALSLERASQSAAAARAANTSVANAGIPL